MPGGGSTSGDVSCQQHQELSSGQDAAFGEIPSVPERAEQHTGLRQSLGHGERASGVQVALAGTGPGTVSLRGVVFSQEDAAMRGACGQQVSRCQVCANPRLGTAAGKGSWDMQRCSEPHLDALGASGGLSHSGCCFFSSFTFLAF